MKYIFLIILLFAFLLGKSQSRLDRYTIKCTKVVVNGMYTDSLPEPLIIRCWPDSVVIGPKSYKVVGLPAKLTTFGNTRIVYLSTTNDVRVSVYPLPDSINKKRQVTVEYNNLPKAPFFIYIED